MADHLLGAGFSDDEVRTMAVVNTGGSRVSKTALVVSAHSADFVWRAAGAIATIVEAGGTAHVVSLSYGERGNRRAGSSPTRPRSGSRRFAMPKR